MANMIDVYYSTKSTVREAIKTLRTNIQFASPDSEIKTIMITSATMGEGKTTTAVFLAIAMAEAGKRTLIVETDCRRPSVGNRLKQRNEYSWLDLLGGQATLEKAAAPTAHQNLYFLDSEPQLANPVELIGSNKFAAMIDMLKDNFDIIIFDTPPLGFFIEAALLASKVDGTIMGISSGKVDGKKALGVMEQLKKANARLLGVILNEVPLAESNYYGYYSYGAEKKSVHKKAKHRKRGLSPVHAR